MTGPRPAGRPWTRAEVAQLHELVASGVKVGSIARKLERSPGQSDCLVELKAKEK
jgi:hypothetical protein